MRINLIKYFTPFYVFLVFLNSLVYFILEIFYLDLTKYFVVLIFAFNLIVVTFYKGANKYQKTIFFILLIFYFISFFRGFFLSNYFSYFFVDISYFSSFSLLLVARHSKNQILDFLNSFERISYYTLPLALYVFITQGFMPSDSINERFVNDENLGMYSSVNIVFYTIYLILFIQYFRNNKFKIVVLFSVIFMLLYSLFTLSRGLFIASLVSLIYTVFIYYSQSVSLINIIKLSFRVIISLIILYLFFSFLYSFDSIDTTLNLLSIRFFDNPDFSGGRNEEEVLLLADLNFVETFIGRGFGGANKTWIWYDLPNGMNLVHKWYLHLILKGGYIYITIFLVISIFTLVNIIIKKQFYLICFFLIFYILSSGHTQFYDFVSISLFWIFVGFGLSSKKI